MPKISLKPNSPEFEEHQKQQRPGQCDMPGCFCEGEFRAPKDRSLSEHYWFCQEHVSEYNKAWNFFEGMADSEVQDHMINSYYGDRPTWKYGVGGDAQEELFRKAWQFYNGDDQPPPKSGFTAGGGDHFAGHGTPEYEAMAIMGLEPPITLDGIKTKYKELAKKYHPDLNKGCEKSEDLLKQINMAYTILKLAYEKYDELPARA